MGTRERPVSYRDFVALLRRLGFTKIRSRGSHEQWAGEYAGQFRLCTVSPHHEPFHRELLRSMIKQLGMEKDEFFKQLG